MGARLEQASTVMAETLNEDPAPAPRGRAEEPAGEPAGDLADSAAIRASLGQPEQFAVLYDRYAIVLHRYAGRRVGDDAADDLVAATFLAAFRARRRYDQARASARPWLFGILTKEIARRQRTEKARLRALERAWSDRPADGLADRVADGVTAQAARGQLAAALARLSPELRRSRPGPGHPRGNRAVAPEPGAQEGTRGTGRNQPGGRERGATMNELTSLRDLGEALDQELRGPSPQLRHTVLTGISRQPGRALRARRRPGLGWRLVVASGLAVALAAALLAVSTMRLWGASPAASAQAADILSRAADAARHQPALTPAPSQFIYFKSIGRSAAIGDGNQVTMQAELREVWLSADGTRNGLVRHVEPPCSNTTGSGAVCQPQPGYPAGLPTSAGAMLAYLYRNSHGQNPPAVQAFITAGDLISVSYLRPAALAALFGALEKLPGVSVADHAVNAAGQPGVAVQQTFHGMSYQLIFNPRTYAFIGGREVSVSASAGLRVSTILFSYAILRLAVVNHAGQLP